jgi:hypothetical protein
MNDTPSAFSKIVADRHRKMTPLERWLRCEEFGCPRLFF